MGQPLASEGVFAGELQKLRHKAGLTQEEVAAKAGVSRQYVSMLEAGKYMPTIEIFIRLAHAVGISPAEFITRIDRSMKKRGVAVRS